MIESYVNKVIIVDQQFMDDLKHRSRTEMLEFSNPDIDTQVVTLPLSSPSEIASLTRFMDPSDIRAGSIVVKPGYTDQFVPVDTFVEDIVYRKYGLFVQFCIALGAKKVSISSIEDVSLETNEVTSIGGGGGVSAPLGKSEADASLNKSSLNEEFCKSIMNLNTEAKGGEPNLEIAEGLIQQYGLQKDSLFTDILNMCRVPTNRLCKHEISLDFSKDVKRIFDSSIQAKIKVMGNLYQGRIEFEKARKSMEKSRNATKLSVVVEF